jgi:hypothetical protein
LLHYRLKELFNKEVDVVTERTLTNPYLVENINKSKLLIYEAGDKKMKKIKPTKRYAKPTIFGCINLPLVGV